MKSEFFNLLPTPDLPRLASWFSPKLKLAVAHLLSHTHWLCFASVKHKGIRFLNLVYSLWGRLINLVLWSGIRVSPAARHLKCIDFNTLNGSEWCILKRQAYIFLSGVERAWILNTAHLQWEGKDFVEQRNRDIKNIGGHLN